MTFSFVLRHFCRCWTLQFTKNKNNLNFKYVDVYLHFSLENLVESDEGVVRNAIIVSHIWRFNHKYTHSAFRLSNNQHYPGLLGISFWNASLDTSWNSYIFHSISFLFALARSPNNALNLLQFIRSVFHIRTVYYTLSWEMNSNKLALSI